MSELGTPVRPTALGDCLRRARRRTGLSQAALALQLGVSQRHISFVECGRSRPGVRLLSGWARTCGIGAGEHALLMDLAGYGLSVATDTASLTRSCAAAHIDSAAMLLLGAEKGLAAYAFDADWIIIGANASGRRLAALLMPGAVERDVFFRVSLMQLLQDRDALGGTLLNSQDVFASFYQEIGGQAASSRRVQQEDDSHQPQAKWAPAATEPDARTPLPSTPLLSRYRTRFGDIALHSVFATLSSTPAASREAVRIEYLSPANSTTREVLARLDGLSSRR